MALLVGWEAEEVRRHRTMPARFTFVCRSLNNKLYVFYDRETHSRRAVPIDRFWNGSL